MCWTTGTQSKYNLTVKGKKGGKGSFDPLFIPPLSQIRLARLDNVRMIFPKESKEQCCNVTIRHWEDRDRAGREMEGWDWINVRDYESIFLETLDQCVRNCGVFPAVNRKEPTLQCYYFPFTINTRDLQVCFMCCRLQWMHGCVSLQTAVDEVE